MRRLVLLGAVALIVACAPRGTVIPEDAGKDRLLRADLAPARGIDILFLTSDRELIFASIATASVVTFRRRLLERVSRTAPKDIHLGVLSATVRETVGCAYSSKTPTGHLEHGKEEASILTAEADAESWEQRLWHHYLCGLPQYFEPMRLSLDGRNPGFPRPDALLVVLLMAPENDCSLKDESLLSKAELWPAGLNKFYGRCSKPPKGLLFDVEEYVDALLARHSQRIFVFVATVPRSASFVQEGAYSYVANIGVCHYATGSAGPRFADFVKAIEARKDPRLRVKMTDVTKTACSDLLPQDFVDEIVRFGAL